VNAISGGVEGLASGIVSNLAVLNQRGWVAGLDSAGNLAIWDGYETRTLGTPTDNAPEVTLAPIAMNNLGWVILSGTPSGFWLWDGTGFRSLAEFVADRNIGSVAGLTDCGKIALTLVDEGSTSTAAILMPTEPLQSLDEIFKPESGPELHGHGEYVGCDAMTGWAISQRRRGTPVPVEVYEGTRLIGATVASVARPENGTFGYHMPIPAALHDGLPHFVNVRFGGTMTAIEESWGTITCFSDTAAR
jgi:hypothetical protein